ncbi:uncharacterized protein LOC106172697 [Lingula anatina]|uniref:Uncharacterized protein LOC106172697 n=1 Tax=Lingula anatina TaxID=7574 RepID=A0A1S3JF14_LINAN|nr:uncharacterized protein LOC106172697 [Lingula anatina]|eukprot:XP_013409005.1 uncharacterized protein LOC106172697 [Lingula anatina]
MGETEAITMVSQLQSLLQTGGFHLTKWISNSREVLSKIPDKDKAKPIKNLDLNLQALPTERALGVCWDIEVDSFTYKMDLEKKPLTKRGLLSVISSIYDPLGFISPFTISSKKMLQDLTRDKIGWDETVPYKTQVEWSGWKNSLPKMKEMKVPRCVQPVQPEKIASIQLHHFSDASTMAYGVVSYLRVQDISGQIHTSLLMSKARLAPIKQLTIPRLELTAATMAVRLDYMIRQELTFPVDSSIFWTDSTCTLSYIQSEDKRFQTYVENRVSVIREGSIPSQWHYIDSKRNPADDCTRGLTAHEMINSIRWIEGPEFLKQSECHWPETPEVKGVSDEDKELKRPKTCLAQRSESVQESVIDKILKRRSSWKKLKKDVAVILRFKQWLIARHRREKVNVPTGLLSVEETEKAELEILKYIQGQHFGKELSEINRAVNSQSGVKRASMRDYFALNFH